MKSVNQLETKQSIHEILEYFREEARNNRDLGDKFEKLIASYLKKDPYYAEHFSDVWLWSEWPRRGNKPDTGIDLVAQERATGDFCAIQCKFFDSSHQLQKADIDSFFTASGKEPFKKRLIISTTDKWSKHAEDACKNQHVPVSRIRVQDLDQSPIDWAGFNLNRPQALKLKPKKKLRKHQEEALTRVVDGLKKADRGKLIMACGTGKTFTSLKIAETIVPEGGDILFLVPSISLISQTLMEWSAEAEKPLSCFAVCSDPQAGKKKDEEDISTHDLAFPAHTNPNLLAKQVRAMRSVRKSNLNVVFSTYQSIGVISEAQKLGLPQFDLVICDEAHRTTGVESLEYGVKEASAFVSVHKSDYIKTKKRLYMTATPRIYDDASKGKAKEAEVEIYSMDDEATYGKELHRLDFSEAVRRGLLSDYKVMVLAVDEKYVDKAFQSQLANKDNELVMEDVVKIVGCYNGLKKKFIPAEGDGSEIIDSSPMHRAVAFSRSIKDSKKITEYFSGIIREYQPTDDETEDASKSDFLQCQVEHVDGTFNALLRNEKLQWLKEDTTRQGNVCRILSNARCLSEGVDVPALDAVMFLNPRNSVVDVVQSVGRVMRKVEGKQYGYIILPVGIPADVSPEEALADNERYRVVWQVLQALRAHDNRFNAIINQLDLNKKRPEQIQIIGVGEPGSEHRVDTPNAVQTTFNFPHLEDWENAIFAKIVVKCGSRRYWEDWAKDVAKIAERHIARIKSLLKSSNDDYRKKFHRFLSGLRKTLNPSISEEDAIEMLSQHLITKPVFDALFEGYEFTKQNPVSKTMQKMLDLLEEQSLEKETASLEKFYESVRERARGIDNAEGKQKIIVELYDKFFRAAFPGMAERLGIVYTPIEVVDFILNSANSVLKSEFGAGLTDKNVHILDPFTGTGTFIVRLLQTQIIEDKDLDRKFHSELHANEIILLAYYIAAINIEEAYHGRMKKEYEPFEGIVLTDTFQLSEGKGAFDDAAFQINSDRALKQNKEDIRVIVGNPPYSKGQGNQNDNNQNVKYPNLDQRIEQTYAKQSLSTNLNSLYDSYIRALRWASDRIKDKGIVCFVNNGGFIDANAMSGLRKCLADEFSAIYCFNLRGNARTSGEQRRMEKGNVFGEGTRTPVAITLFLKNPAKPNGCKLYYHDIGDYLTREQKLGIIKKFGSVEKISWENITPNKNNDWINQRDDAFEKFIPMGLKDDKGKRDAEALFVMYSMGVKTNRDSWTYNFSKEKLAKNMSNMIDRYNMQVEGFQKVSSKGIKVNDYIDFDPKKISWSRGLIADVEKNKKAKFERQNIRPSYYRPFTKEHLYFHGQFNDMIYRIPVFYPNADSENLAICVSGVGAGKDFSAFLVNFTPNLHFHDTGQCFPLRYYEASKGSNVAELGLDYGVKSGWQENVSDYAVEQFRNKYKDKKISREDIFYYVYGILHSEEYKRRFSSDLRKTLPRIPFAEDFRAFSSAGHKLADIHLNYEKAKAYPIKEHVAELNLDAKKIYRVEKMRFGKNAKEVDKTIIYYNSNILLKGIPLEAYEYIVNGRSAIEWVMDQYQLSTDKDSQITNDPNDWAAEQDDPKYILNLLKRVITVSLETVKIVKSLPSLNEIK